MAAIQNINVSLIWTILINGEVIKLDTFGYYPFYRVAPAVIELK
jgi:hypothetical protein